MILRWFDELIPGFLKQVITAERNESVFKNFLNDRLVPSARMVHKPLVIGFSLNINKKMNKFKGFKDYSFFNNFLVNIIKNIVHALIERKDVRKM